MTDTYQFMNSRRVSLVLTIVNLVLAGALTFMVYSMRVSPEVVLRPAKTRVVTNTVTQIAVRKINATNLLAALATRPINWRALESTNYVIYIENLRNFGCPEETIRDIITADVAKLYAQRRAELRARQPFKFWETADPLSGTPGMTPELQRQLRDLDKEQRQLIRELLGVDYRTEAARYWNDTETFNRDFSFLPQAKQESVQAVAEKFEELEQDVYWRSRGLLLSEDQEELKQIQRQRRAELAAVLTPEELEEYDLRHSDTARTMRSQLAGFQPTEQEFRKIFRLQRTFDDNFDQAFDSRDDAAQAVKAKAQQEAQDALNEQVKGILGPERYAEYQRAQDTDYRALLQLGERFELSGEVANKVYNMKQAAEQYKLRVESNPNLTDDQRAQAMAALARETERYVSAAMGNDIFKAYQRSGGQWLANLLALDESVLPPPPAPTGTYLPYDINLLPPELRTIVLNPPVPPPFAK